VLVKEAAVAAATVVATVLVVVAAAAATAAAAAAAIIRAANTSLPENYPMTCDRFYRILRIVDEIPRPVLDMAC
jgi:hypothetical protein